MAGSATAISSGDVSDSSQVITTSRSLVHAIMISGAGKIRVYDGTDNSGTLLAVVNVSDPERSRDVEFSRPARAWNGIYVEVVDSPDDAVIHYG